MASEIDIVNVALARLGADMIRSFDEVNKRSRLSKVLYDFIRDAYLTGYAWTFAREFRVLQPDEEQGELAALAGGIKYVMPSDCLKALDVMPYGSKPNWTVAGRFLYTSANPAILFFIKRVTESGHFNNNFTNSVAARLASALCPSITQNEKLQSLLQEEARMAWYENTADDANIGSSYRHPNNDPNNDTFVYPDLAYPNTNISGLDD